MCRSPGPAANQDAATAEFGKRRTDEVTTRVSCVAAVDAFGRAGAAPALNHDVEDISVVVEGAPKIVLLAADADEHLVHVPLVAGLVVGTASAYLRRSGQSAGPTRGRDHRCMHDAAGFCGRSGEALWGAAGVLRR